MVGEELGLGLCGEMVQYEDWRHEDDEIRYKFVWAGVLGVGIPFVAGRRLSLVLEGRRWLALLQNYSITRRM